MSNKVQSRKRMINEDEADSLVIDNTSPKKVERITDFEMPQKNDHLI